MTATTCPSNPRGRPTAGEPRITVDTAGERDLRFMAGVITGLVGAMLLIVPHHLSNPTYALIARHPTVWGIGFLLSGLGLLAVDVLPARRPLLLALHLLVGAAWLLLAFGFLITKGWIGMAAWGVFGLGIAVEPFLSVHRAGAAVLGSASPFSVLNALTASLLGVAMFVTLITHDLGPFFSPVRKPMLFAATSMVVAGPLLLYALRRRPARPWPWFWGAHLLVGGFYLLYGVGLSWRVQAWTGVVLYAGLGGSLCLAPVFQERLRTVASSSLAVRMSVFVSIALTIAMVVTATIASRHFVRVYGVSEDAVRSVRESTFGVLLVSLAVAVIVVVHTARWVGAPLRDLSVVAGKLAAGDGAAVLPHSRVHEIRGLVASFAEMRDRLAARTLEREQSLKRLEDQTGELRAARDSAESAHRELKESYERLRELEQLRDSLVHMVVHDLSSPLTTVDTLLELLRRAEADRLSERSRAAVEHCLEALHAMKSMVGSVLDVSKMEAGAMRLRPQPCDVAGICRDVLQAMYGLVGERRITLEVEGAVPVMADPDVVSRVVQNLLGNALKFTPREGEIRIRVRADDEALRFTVADTGLGVPEEFQEKIFEKFGQVEAHAHGQRKSPGLGLTFCKLAVEAHGGHIGVESDGEHGSTFWFTLPRS